MKKFIAPLLAIVLLVFAAPAMADWSVTVTWTPSVSPHAGDVVVLINGGELCTPSPDSTAPTCNGVVPSIENSQVVVRTYVAGSDAIYADSQPVEINMPGVVPASGVTVNATWIQGTNQ